MIVCSCNVLTDTEIRGAVLASEAPLTTGEVYGCLGCSRQCGRCARTIKKIMHEALTDVCSAACTGEQCNDGHAHPEKPAHVHAHPHAHAHPHQHGHGHPHGHGHAHPHVDPHHHTHDLSRATELKAERELAAEAA
ncbi:bacterioferritin-associated ferredoxin [Rhodopseudomonas rhenobacensis]|uniref:Bacterioferritin-associated ferredoxin n=1 Tax=Rhodopseudomonas rhenobacensis TaxID=87461 RepID=A0A7W7Z5J7_9BRAD|nr:(2Fe-2S)-binding protein [Rhodopseudomonas rhenobacensis]MBB5048150.1 bacterioferritin-associated ferredoxin [Rhodopseudomonas rhenobacensis]